MVIGLLAQNSIHTSWSKALPENMTVAELSSHFRKPKAYYKAFTTAFYPEPHRSKYPHNLFPYDPHLITMLSSTPTH